MRELIETIDRLTADLNEVLERMIEGDQTPNLMMRVGHLDWEIEMRTKALMNLMRLQYA